MLGCGCFHWSRTSGFLHPERKTFSLPAPIPQWPPGQGFATGTINLGAIKVFQISEFEFLWECNASGSNKNGVSFYKPVKIPNGFFCLGHYCQSNDKPLHGFVLVACESTRPGPEKSCFFGPDHSPALLAPVDYTLVWSSNDGSSENLDGGYFWLPEPPEGYKAMGFVVTNRPIKPDLDEIRCVREDLTDESEAYSLILSTNAKYSQLPFGVRNLRPLHRGMHGRGVSVGTFFCSSYWISTDELNIPCLKNLNPALHGMPNLDQAHGLIQHYGPTVFFHPEEAYLPSSVPWFFKNGARLCQREDPSGESIDAGGSNLPSGGNNDGNFWIDLPAEDGQRENVKCGNLDTAKLYVHVKPAYGGTFTDIAMWVFCPFNGPVTVKVGFMNFALTKVGQHVGDWEHFTLRISNFTGELWSVYFSQHSGGEWVDSPDLEFVDGNKPAVYSSKSGHASFSRPGNYIQGSSKLGIGIRNDAARSNYAVDSSTQYEIVAAEYLGEGVVSEPCWLQYMREWGPTIVYDSRNEIDKVINLLPFVLRYSVENIFDKFPLELYGEEGPTGPKEKNNWHGDERW